MNLLGIEAKKKETIDKKTYNSLNNSPLNYNKYAWSLMKDDEFVKRHNIMMDAVSSMENIE